MQFAKVLASVASIALLTGMVMISTPTGATETAEREAKQVIEHYLNAVSSGNVDEIIKYSKDEREPDDSKRKEMLQRFIQKNPINKLEVLSMKFLNDKNISVTLSGEFGETSETKTLPLIKENDQWKILIKDNN